MLVYPCDSFVGSAVAEAFAVGDGPTRIPKLQRKSLSFFRPFCTFTLMWTVRYAGRRIQRVWVCNRFWGACATQRGHPGQGRPSRHVPEGAAPAALTCAAPSLRLALLAPFAYALHDPHLRAGAQLQASDRGSASALRQLLLTADLVVHEILGHETAARDAVVALAQEPVGGAGVGWGGQPTLHTCGAGAGL